MRKEVKIGLALISLLLGVFGFVLYKRIQGRQLEAQQALAAKADIAQGPAGDASTGANPAEANPGEAHSSTAATTTTALRPASEHRSEGKGSSLLDDAWNKPGSASRDTHAAAPPARSQWQAPSPRESGSQLSIASTPAAAAEETARPELTDFAGSPQRSFAHRPESEPGHSASPNSTLPDATLPPAASSRPTTVDPISALRPETPPATLSNMPPGGNASPARDPFAGSGSSADRYAAAAPLPGGDLDEPPPAAVDAFHGADRSPPPPARLAYADTTPPSHLDHAAPGHATPGQATSPPAAAYPVASHRDYEHNPGPAAAQPSPDPRDRYSSGAFSAAAPAANVDPYAQGGGQLPPDHHYQAEPAPVRGSLTGTGKTVVQGRFAGAVDQASAAGYTNAANAPARPAENQDRWQPDRRNVVEPQQPYYDDRAAVPASAVSHAAPAAAPNGQYTVQPGDSFWVISRKLYGDGSFFKALTEHNRREYPQSRNLQVGDVVSAPAAEDLRQAYPDLCPKLRQPLPGVNRPASAQKLAGSRIYVVEDGDTLFDIARHELGSPARWVEIYELNADRLSNDFDYIRQGTELILPGNGAPRPRETVTGRPAAASPR